jgi:hypothetical protein
MRIQDHAYATVTNKDGRFWFGGIPEGTYTLIAQVDGLTAQRAVTVPGDEYDVLLASAGKGAKARKGG